MLAMHYTYSGTVTSMRGRIFREIPGRRYSLMSATDPSVMETRGQFVGTTGEILTGASFANMAPVGMLPVL